MRYYKQENGYFKVTYDHYDAVEFNKRWPASTIQGQGSFEFDSDGNLIDVTGTAETRNSDGRDWLAFSQDCQNYAYKVEERLEYLFRQALQIQNACNLCGLAQTFAKVMIELNDIIPDGDARNQHPIVTLWLDKFNSLNGIQFDGLKKIDKAYDLGFAIEKKPSTEEIIKNYLSELSKLEKEVSVDQDLIFDLAKSYQANYPDKPQLYDKLVASVLRR